MPAKWIRLEPVAIPAQGLVMATGAKKHITIFRRRPTAKGAGRPEVKAAFKKIAGKTGGIPLRIDRNIIMGSEMKKAGLKTGKFYKRSRSKYAPLAGKFYELEAGQTVGAAISARGLEAILTTGRK